MTVDKERSINNKEIKNNRFWYMNVYPTRLAWNTNIATV